MLFTNSSTIKYKLVNDLAKATKALDGKKVETTPGPDWHKLYRWIVSQALVLPFRTMYLITDNRDLVPDEVKTTPGLGHWPMVAAWWQE